MSRSVCFFTYGADASGAGHESLSWEFGAAFRNVAPNVIVASLLESFELAGSLGTKREHPDLPRFAEEHLEAADVETDRGPGRGVPVI